MSGVAGRRSPRNGTGVALKILVVSNGYPPHHVGGYEIGCRDVVEGLKGRGHSIRVLTSTFGVGKPRVDGEVWRRFRLNRAYQARTPLSRATRPFRIFALYRKERTNQTVFREALREFKPDMVYIWNPSGVSMSVSLLAAEAGVPVCYFVSDDWMARFPNEELWFLLLNGGFLPAGISAVFTPLLRSAARTMGLVTGEGGVEFANVQFASQYLMDGVLRSGKAVRNATVIHWGIDPDRFPPRPRSATPPRRLLYVGQVVPHKGVHTAVEALKIIRDEHGFADATLDVVGGHSTRGYAEELARRVKALGLGDAVRFRGSIPRDTLPAVYHEHDVLIFPSIWPEPFSIALLEGLSSGLAVVGTTTGGSPEILEHGVNAMTFAADDPRDCAAQVARLFGDPELYERVRERGRRTTQERFRFSDMVDQVEAALAASTC